MPTSIEKDHNLGINVVCQHLQQAGATVQRVNRTLGEYPQVIATIEGILHFIAVVTERHPAEPRLGPGVRSGLIEHAGKHSAVAKFAPVGLWSTGTRNEAGDEGFYVRFAGLEDLRAETPSTGTGAGKLSISVKGGAIRMPSLRSTRPGQPRPAQVNLSKDAEYSTIVRLLAHHWCEMLATCAQEPDTPPSIRDDYETMLRYLGVHDYEGIGPQQRAKWEAAVVSYLAYEGPKMPDAAEAEMFRNLREMLAKESGIARVSLPAEVRGVMSRMLVAP